MSGVTEGKKFSLNYLARGAPGADSPRFRLRLQRAFDQVSGDINFGMVIESEVGARVPWATYGPNWRQFFAETPIHDLLDAITVIFQTLRDNGYSKTRAPQFRDQVRRIISEENLGYRLDDRGGVHLGVDDEFDHNRVSTVQALGLARYNAARTAFDAAHSAPDQSPPDGQAAIRSTFDALETVFRLILTKKVTRLGAAEVEKHLKPIALARHGGQARDATNQMVNALSDWVNAGHNYRHARGAEAHEAVPIELAVLMVSSGASFLRWLVDLDQANLAA